MKFFDWWKERQHLNTVTTDVMTQALVSGWRTVEKLMPLLKQSSRCAEDESMAQPGAKMESEAPAPLQLCDNIRPKQYSEADSAPHYLDCL